MQSKKKRETRGERFPRPNLEIHGENQGLGNGGKGGEEIFVIRGNNL